MNWTNKLAAKVYTLLTIASGWVVTLLLMPPEQQQGILKDVIALVSPHWQPWVALFFKTATTISLFKAVQNAAHSGPQSPPSNPPNQ